LEGRGGKIFSLAPRELLPTRCGGTAKEKILKIVHIATNIKIYTEFYVRTCSSSLARCTYSSKHTTKCFEVQLNRFMELLPSFWLGVAEGVWKGKILKNVYFSFCLLSKKHAPKIPSEEGRGNLTRKEMINEHARETIVRSAAEIRISRIDTNR